MYPDGTSDYIICKYVSMYLPNLTLIMETKNLT